MTLKRQRSNSDGNANINDVPSAKRVTTDRDDTLHRLSGLLDFTSVNDSKDILAQFSAIANILFHEARLQVTSEQTSNTSRKATTTVTADYELLEAEFYLWKQGSHEDPFTHGSEEQRRSGRWYFHRAPTKATGASSASGPRPATAAGGYRGGTRKGLDLTFGSPIESTTKVVSRSFATPQNDGSEDKTQVLSTTDIRGGILLRTMRRISDGKVISGPSLLVDEILRVTESPNIATLVNEQWSKDTRAWDLSPSDPTEANPARTLLRLVPVTKDASSFSQAKPHIYSSPRIGLDLSHPTIPIPSTLLANTKQTLNHPRLSFISRTYRYFIHPELLIANGRGHTFLGVYRFLTTSQEYSKAKLKSELVKRTGLKENTVQKYIQEYEESVKDGRINSFIGAKGKGAGSNPMTALSMFGTLASNGL